jgi:hypothetical protein
MATEITSSPEVYYKDGKNSSDKAADTEKIQLERMETGGYAGKNHTDFSQVDGEVAKYTSEVRTVIDQATNKRLRKLIDRRVLAIMIFTYFLQALTKVPCLLHPSWGFRSIPTWLARRQVIPGPQHHAFAYRA